MEARLTDLLARTQAVCEFILLWALLIRRGEVAFRQCVAAPLSDGRRSAFFVAVGRAEREARGDHQGA